ncbi:uncharacterized protein LOC135391695 isoform X2 [Ornithodoros turicata]|uniref:uncharacterized protein LOC135391695 isoform X2 n=1 Tax=Ornithodoros turicata TaxID=34597 RepID=UPI003139FF69
MKTEADDISVTRLSSFCYLRNSDNCMLIAGRNDKLLLGSVASALGGLWSTSKQLLQHRKKRGGKCTSGDNDPVWLWTVDEYPHPIHHPRYCNRYGPSFVCDPDRILCTHEADALDRLIERIRNETVCICPSCETTRRPHGITLGVALMANLYKSNNEPISEAVRRFAETLRNKWSLGHCNDDIILLISTGDSESYTLVGSAVSGVFPQEVADQIYLESRGHFINGFYYQGLESMIQAYFEMLRRLQDQVILIRQTEGNGSQVGLILGAVFGTLALLTAVGGGVFWYGSRHCDYNYLVASLAESTRKGRRRLSNLRRRRPPTRTPGKQPNGNSAVQEVTCPSTSVALQPPEPPGDQHESDGESDGESESGSASQDEETVDDEEYTSEDGSSSSPASRVSRDANTDLTKRVGSAPVLTTPV